MINSNDYLKEIKDEVIKFKDILELDICENDMIYVIKKMIFFKFIKNSIDETYYCECFISDLLQMLNLLHNDSKRLLYMVYRSAIENSIRVFLGVSKDNYIGINDLFRNFKIFCSGEENLYSFIKGQYSSGCNFTHSNISANINLYEFYKDTLSNDKPSIEDIKKLFNLQKTFLQKIIEIMIIKKTELVDMSFYREKEKLKYLLSKSEYELYKKCLSVI